jgi:hypothetical protein
MGLKPNRKDDPKDIQTCYCHAFEFISIATTLNFCEKIMKSYNEYLSYTPLHRAGSSVMPLLLITLMKSREFLCK